MKQNQEIIPPNPARHRHINAAQVTLILLFVFSFFLAGQGLESNRIYEASGFDNEAAYPAIYALGNKALESWHVFQDSLNALPADKQSEILRVAGERLETFQKVSDKSPESVFRSLYAAFLSGRGKISSAAKKQLNSMNDSEIRLLQSSLLQCIADPQEQVPAVMNDSEKTSDRETLIGNLFNTYFQTTIVGDKRTSEQMNQLKKSVRGEEAQLTASRMIADAEIGWMDQMVISHSRTFVLIGIVLALNAVILFYLMQREKNWRLDLKWLLILAVSDFLLVFQLFPLLFLLQKAFFPEEQFSLETFKRLYTYPLNLDALSNTLIASFATMILGTALAFPLAWLTGRTNLYGRRFFRSLFVMTYMVPPYVGAMAWLRLLNPNVGTLNIFIRNIFQLGDQPGPLNL